MKITNFLILISVCLLIGCATAQKTDTPIWRLPSEGITVKDGVIYHKGIPQAEIRYKEQNRYNPTKYRGFALFYIILNKEIRIFPDLGGDKGEYLSWCFDIHISDDGKYIFYKTPGLLFDYTYRYSVEYGDKRRISKVLHQRLF